MNGKIVVASALVLASLTAGPAFSAEHFPHPRGDVLDSRYDHGRFYPPLGAVRPALPGEYRPYVYGGSHFYFSAGVWYAPRGQGFVVVHPPAGLVINALPPYYSTVWIGGVPYYYANEVYYVWEPDKNAYVIVDPPAHAENAVAAPPNTPEDLIIYPKNGQSTAQQAADRYECHRWAKAQTGFDPTEPAGTTPGVGGQSRSSYNRAMSACLQGRGYQVN